MAAATNKRPKRLANIPATTPAALVETAYEFAREYRSSTMRSFKDGCRLLEREVNGCLTHYFSEKFESEDARILRRHLVRFRFRVGTVKAADSIAVKVLEALPDRYRAS